MRVRKREMRRVIAWLSPRMILESTSFCFSTLSFQSCFDESKLPPVCSTPNTRPNQKCVIKDEGFPIVILMAEIENLFPSKISSPIAPHAKHVQGVAA